MQTIDTNLVAAPEAMYTADTAVVSPVRLAKARGRRLLLGLLLGAVMLACVLMGLTLPASRTVMLNSFAAPVLSPIAAYLNAEPELAEPIRVADQQDAARSQKTDLSKERAQITAFLSKKYRLAASEVAKFVEIADSVAKKAGLETSLVLAVMSIESNLNPIMESPVGAQGLMQVLTAVHLDKLAAFGGAERVFDPFTNISVGTQILVNCIKLGGSVEMGLKCYVGATGPTDNGYGLKVLAEKERIEKSKFGVLDFSPNNKVLIDLNIQAGNNQNLVEQIQASNAPALHGADLAVTAPVGSTIASQAPNAPAPLIPSSVTALPNTAPVTILPGLDPAPQKLEKSVLASQLTADTKQK